MATDEGGRLFFSGTDRTLALEDEIRLLSVGVDIGSSTSHLVFSRIVLERLDARYVVAGREVIWQSDILLTPYEAGETINAEALGAFIAGQYDKAALEPDNIDTGALILTGVAAGRRNARAIGDLFAREAGKLVAVSAGDGLETMLAAYGSGAVARSIRDRATILNVDVGGGTAKLAVCANGRITSLTALDVGARLINCDDAGRIVRLEPAGSRIATEIGLALAPGQALGDDDATALAEAMADRLFEAIAGGEPLAAGTPLLRLPPLNHRGKIDAIEFSGGVAEYIYGAERRRFGDLGPQLARAIRARVEANALRLIRPLEAIRATVIGASQYAIQVSGSTIYVSPPEALPLRNLAVIAPDLPFAGETVDADAVAAAIAGSLARHDLGHGMSPVALFVPWRGSATFDRIDGFCRGVALGLAPLIAHRQPVVLAGDGDVGGLVGIHCRETLGLANAIVSIDGLDLKEFDYIDIGALIPASGAVPVVIKSLIFPAAAAAP